MFVILMVLKNAMLRLILSSGNRLRFEVLAGPTRRSSWLLPRTALSAVISAWMASSHLFLWEMLGLLLDVDDQGADDV